MTECAHIKERLCPGVIAGVLEDEVFTYEDATVVALSAPGGTGKTFAAVELAYYMVEKLGYYLLTNIPFQRRTPRSKTGWTPEFEPHAHARVVMTLRDLWIQYGMIKQRDPYAVVMVVLDEWHKWVDRMTSWEQMPIDLKDWWGEDRKYRTVPFCITQRVKNIPRQILPYVKWYAMKSAHLTAEYNAAFHHHYGIRDLIFLAKVVPGELLEYEEENQDETKGRVFHLCDVEEVLIVERGPWTTDPNEAKAGDVCYWSETGSTFEPGKVRGREDWFKDFLRHISGCHPTELGDRILEYFEEDPTREAELANFTSADLAIHVYRSRKSEMPPEASGHPVIKVGPHKGRRLVQVELNPTNLARIFGCSQSTLSKRFERMG